MTDILSLILYLLLLLSCFPVLYYISENYFIRSLEDISRRFRIPSDIAGSTLMAAGSSTPELAVVLFALLKSGHHEAIGVGTIVGSALFNLFVIVGAVFLIYRSRLVWQPLIRDLFFYLVSIVLLALFFMNGNIELYEAVIFVAIYIIYIFSMYLIKKIKHYEDIEKVSDNKSEGEEKIKRRCTPKYIMECIDRYMRKHIPALNNMFVSFFSSLVMICLISWLMVTSAVNVSELLGVPEILIGLTIMAVGTSIPDLLSSIIVARQGRPGMAINNAIGSNIFDILIGFGLPWVLLLLFSGRTILVNNHDLLRAFGLLFGSVIILTASFLLNKWHMKKGIGFLLIFLYIIYLIWEVVRVI